MKKTNQELGYTIPVQKQIAPGVKKIAFAKDLTPRNGTIKVRTHKGRPINWGATGVEPIENYRAKTDSLIVKFESDENN